MSANPAPSEYPVNPVVVRVERAGVVESVHRGAWCLVDASGEVLAGAGAFEHAYFARSAIKSLQALALLESGAAERFGFSDAELALAIASHAGESCHTEVVHGTLERLGLGLQHLRCGAHAPFDARTRAELAARQEAPTALHNNCSGKHVGFLALARQLGVPPERYLEPDSAGQALVRRLVSELTGTPERALVPGIDGCSAPTYRLSLRALATAFARLANPEGLAPVRRAQAARLTRVAGAHPALIAGSAKVLDTELLRASGGRLFGKIGAEAVHAIGVLGGGQALALKVDDGGARALPVLVLGLLEGLGLARPAELAALGAFRETTLRNIAGLEVGRIEAVLEPRVERPAGMTVRT
jgi:L-asparaginase II